METPGIWSIIVIINLTSLTFCNGTYSVVSSDASSDDHPEVDYQPRHVHLALGENSDTMVVTWSTVNITSGSVVLIGKDKLTDQFTGTSTRFVDGGELQATQFIHTVKLTKLEPNRYLMYSVGSDEGWSPLLRMKTPQVGPDWSPVIALFGDMGNENAVSLPHLQKGALEDAFDMIIHVGDFAYDMYEDNGTRGDLFMEQIEPIASMIPYMTCPGNHEYHYNFSNYKGRFSNSMPGDAGDLFYTFTIGPVRFFSVSTEYYYYYLEDGLVGKQYNWLQLQLEKASSADERAKHPWLVVFGHRPMYCSNTDGDDCTKYETKTRVGFPPLYNLGLESLLYEYGVDLAVWAHEHNYERLLPIYNRQIFPGNEPGEPYRNPGATVHITSGSAGCRENHDGFVSDPAPWSVFRSQDYGYTIMEASNKTHLHIKQISVEQDNKVIDEFWIIKDTHGPFGQDSVVNMPSFNPYHLNNLNILLFIPKVTIILFWLVCLWAVVRLGARFLVQRTSSFSKNVENFI